MRRGTQIRHKPSRHALESLECRRLLSVSPQVGLDALAHLDQLPYIATGELSGGQSSYDRTGGNGDLGNFLRVNPNGESVIFDRTGPGEINRIWFTNVPATARVRMYFDGETTPRVDDLISDLVAGKDARFLAPLVADPNSSSGGYLTYEPLVYSQSLLITVTNPGALYYNVGYKTFAPGTPVTTWTGSEDSRAVRDEWNRIGSDPKSLVGNTTVSGTTSIPANSSQTIADLSGPQSISSIKIKIPGVENTQLPATPVTDDGRAQKGSSVFTMTLPGNSSPVTLVRRLDYGIADQKATVFVDGVNVGTWFDAGSDQVNHWRDSSFALPVSSTSGKTSITVKVQFVSSSVDWNEFRYTAMVNGAAVDVLDVGNTASETAHHYVITTQTWTGTRTFTYPPAAASTPFADTGRADTGMSSFTMAIDPANRGVNLVRLLDHSVADQRAGVYINGTYVGDWIDAGSDATDSWKISTFYIPEQFTLNKSSINVQIKFVSSASAWTEYCYETHSIAGDGSVLSDTLDVGDTTSEAAHAYQITGQTFFGSHTYTYPHPSINSRTILNSTRLQIFWDGETTPSVDAPLGSFFGIGQFGVAAVGSLMIGLDADNNLYAYFPMPFRQRAVIKLVNQQGVVLSGVTYEVQSKPFTDSFDGVGYFKTSYNVYIPTTSGHDAVFLDTGGSGKLVGVTDSMSGVTSRSFLEGDERVYIDGSSTPAFQGTGTEDFFNGAYYFSNGTYTNASSGNSQHLVEGDGTGTTVDETVAYRLFLGDAITFRNHLRVSIEHGSGDSVNDNMWTLAYYYQTPTVQSVLSDHLNVGDTGTDAASEGAHNYVINTPTFLGSNSFTYDGEFNNVTVTDSGRADKGFSEFDLTLDRHNQGAILRRRLDQGVADQKANVYVNGTLVGTWYKAGANTSHRWADDDFILPASVTQGLSTIHVRIQFVSSANDWNEFVYDAYSLLPQDTTPPTVQSASFDFLKRQAVTMTFSEDVGNSLTAGGVTVTNLTMGVVLAPSAYTVLPRDPASPTVRTIVFNGVLADGNYNLSIPTGGVTDVAGNGIAADYAYGFYVLAGDANRDRTVDYHDFNIWQANTDHPGDFSQGDFDYNGIVDFNDFMLLQNQLGMTLPLPVGMAQSSGAAPTNPVSAPTPPPAPIPAPAPTPVKPVPKAPLPPAPVAPIKHHHRWRRRFD